MTNVGRLNAALATTAPATNVERLSKALGSKGPVITGPKYAGKFGGLKVGDHFILMPASSEAALLKKTGETTALSLYNNNPLTNVSLDFVVQKVKM